MDSIIIGILVAVFVWLFMHQRRKRQLQRIQAQQQQGPEEPPQTMPRLGQPGTVTKEQLERLKENHFEPGKWWSREEADLILDTVTYLRAAIRQSTGETDAPDEIQNKILAFILTDEELRDYILNWGENRRNKDITGPPDELRENEYYERVAAFIRSLHDEC